MTLVKKHWLRMIPASWSILLSSMPELPTKGAPSRTSWSPGASPTIMIRAGAGPVGRICITVAPDLQAGKVVRRPLVG